jgi:hypothetical protein
MELNLKNGGRILIAQIQQKNEESSAAERSLSVKLLFPSMHQGKKKEEIVCEWFAVKGNDLCERIAQVADGEWIVAEIAPKSGNQNPLMVNFIFGEGVLIGAKGTEG